MLTDFTGADRVFIACGYTDLRRGIDGLAALVQREFHLDPFTNTLFLFCGRRRDRIKALYWEGNGFVLLFCHTGSHCPHHDPEVRHGQSSVPTGAGVESPGDFSEQTDHVQLDPAGSGRLSDTGISPAP